MLPDPVALAQALIRRPSVTPADEGALAVLEGVLKPLGFTCHRLRFEDDGEAPVENLYARIGEAAPHFCFAGHTDVVPPGDASLWQSDPFAAEIKDGILTGRGASDMKAAIAAFVAAAARHLAKGGAKGSISLLITGDEEGIAVNGTVKVLGWLRERGERLDHCLIGEPTSTASTCDTIKIGRRGSINVRFRVQGAQGHVAYPGKARNPIPALAALVCRLANRQLDSGSANFDPSNLSFTTVDVGNPTVNVIPAEAGGGFNIRFNDLHTPESLQALIEAEAAAVTTETGCEITLEYSLTGIAALVEPGPFTDLISQAVESVTGKTPALSTGGGTSDARFIQDLCPVVEMGLSTATMHKSNESVATAEIEELAAIYTALLGAYFANPPQ